MPSVVGEPEQFGNRGKVVAQDGWLYVLLPSHCDDKFAILRSSAESKFQKWDELWVSHGYDGEPLVDPHRHDHLSIMQRTSSKFPDREVVVLDIKLS